MTKIEKINFINNYIKENAKYYIKDYYNFYLKIEINNNLKNIDIKKIESENENTDITKLKIFFNKKTALLIKEKIEKIFIEENKK